MRVLVTGAFGNIGMSTVEELLRQGHTVRCFNLPSAHSRRTARRFRHAAQCEVLWGDIRKPADVVAAVAGQEVIVHLAYVLPPTAYEQPDIAYETNVAGMRLLIGAAQRITPAPRLLFASTFDLFGHTQHLPPPRRVTDPVMATDNYTEHKLAGEVMVRESGLNWLILRFADVPIIGLRSPHPIMFEIPLSTRFEVLHPADAALAIANALNSEEAWNKILLIGGGERCQVTYGEFLSGMLDAAGMPPLPEAAFSVSPYCTDWLDTTESQRLLSYQRYSFGGILAEIARIAGWRRRVTPLVAPLVRALLLRMSPYWRTRRQAALDTQPEVR